MAFADAQSGAIIYSGQIPATIRLAGTVTKGDGVGFSSGWVRAWATVGSVVPMRCVAAEDGVNGQTIVVYFGECVVGGARFTGATANGALYVAEGSATGQYTQTAPSTTGDSNTRVGTALTATLMLITPNYNPDTVA